MTFKQEPSQTISGVSGSAFTPGPWYAVPDEVRPVVKGPGSVSIADIWHPPTGNGRSNARLIAAAPAMYDELAYLANANDWFGQQRFAEDTDADFLLRVLGAVRTRARAAISKALTLSVEGGGDSSSRTMSGGTAPPKSDSAEGH